ncbi:MAG: hypothetical protein Q8R44_02680 [Novosphingobium sp.]|nr:hypothetical protein [Novosphingobium sp.]
MTARHRATVSRLPAAFGLLLLAGSAFWALRSLLPGIGANDVSAGGDDHILLPANGAVPVPVRPRATPTGANAESGRRFAQALVIVPRASGAGSGFVIGPQSESATLAGHKLRVGDVLLTIDGRPLDSARIQNLGDELSAFDAVEVRYERAGQIRNRLLTFD